MATLLGLPLLPLGLATGVVGLVLRSRRTTPAPAPAPPGGVPAGGTRPPPVVALPPSSPGEGPAAPPVDPIVARLAAAQNLLALEADPRSSGWRPEDLELTARALDVLGPADPRALAIADALRNAAARARRTRSRLLTGCAAPPCPVGPVERPDQPAAPAIDPRFPTIDDRFCTPGMTALLASSVRTVEGVMARADAGAIDALRVLHARLRFCGGSPAIDALADRVRDRLQNLERQFAPDRLGPG